MRPDCYGLHFPLPNFEQRPWDNPMKLAAKVKDVIVNGHTIKRFDHHCPWVGQCIALRNYPYFICFISSSTTLCIYVFVFSWVNILHRGGNLWNAITHDIVSTILAMYCFIVVWFVGGLTLFHFYLISTNQTTYENFRYRYDKENPFRKGMVKNVKEIIFFKIPPPMINFRAWATGGYNTAPRSVSSDTVEKGFGISKQAYDIEMGANLDKDGSGELPRILQRPDYKGINEKLKNKQQGVDDGDDDDPASDPFFFPPGLEVKYPPIHPNGGVLRPRNIDST
ncbi:hypothetical protein MLD38_020106 [Melastoma candidum]|nr:hypothetical protein MLD38_020106 [Melastoma candidum]